MNPISPVSAAIAAMLSLALTGTAAEGAQSRTFVSANGAGSTCTRNAPCADFATAILATTAGGTIFCLDSGDFSGVFGIAITKSITIDCTGTQAAVSASAFGVVPIQVNAPNAIVTLRGLSFQGGGIGHIGIEVLDVGELYVDNCRIAGFHSGGFAHGISFRPPSGVSAKLHVSDSTIENNGQPSFGGGIIMVPSGSVGATIERSRVEHNTYGIFANGMGSTSVIAVQVRDSVVSGNAFNGISAFTAAGNATTSITVDRTASTLNGQAGILAQGPAGFVLLGASTVLGNGVGLSTADSGSIFSYQNNRLTGNVSNGAATGTLTVK